MSNPTENLHTPIKDDVILPFRTETGTALGRIVQLGGVVDEVLSAHDYPDPIAELLGEAVALTALLGAALKFEGKLILQLQGKGVVKLLVVDYAAPGKLRGYINFDAGALEAMKDPEDTNDLLGQSNMVITIDQGAEMERYQGIVAVSGQNLAEAAESYFHQSEQIPTLIRLSAGKHYAQGQEDQGNNWHWRSGGLMIQNLSREGGIEMESQQSGNDVEKSAAPGSEPDQDHQQDDGEGDNEDDTWSRLTILGSTVEPHELLDPEIEPERLAYRLFHEEGVRIYQAIALEAYCQCSREKIANFLAQFKPEEIRDMDQDGQIVVNCEFCNKTYEFESSNF